MSSLDIAPHPEGAPTRVRDRRRMRHRLRVSFRRAGICTIWRLGFRQFSFHRIARVPRRTVPDTWTRPPVSCHALFPLTFRRQVRHRTQGPPSNPSRLRRGYNEAPRGAPPSCRLWRADMAFPTRPGRRSRTCGARGGPHLTGPGCAPCTGRGEVEVRGADVLSAPCQCRVTAPARWGGSASH
jgi:hypothetical protein